MFGTKITGTRRFQLLYFVYFTALSGFSLFRNVYLEEIGMTGVQMGTIGFALIISGAIAQPLWGLASDRRGIQKIVLLVGAMASGISLLAYPGSEFLANPFGLLLAGSVLFSIFSSPIIPITNSLILSNGLAFGSIRAFASIAFAVGGLVVGAALARVDTVFIVYLYILGVGVIAVLVRGIAVPDTDLTRDWGIEALRLLDTFDYRMLLATAFVMGMIIHPGEAFFSVYMRGIGLSDGLTGVAFWTVNVTEAVIFFRIARLEVPYKWLLALGTACYLVSYLVFATSTSAVAIIGIHVVLGAGFPLFYYGAVNLAHEVAPSALASTSQAFLAAIGVGAGNAIGQVLAGYLIDAVGVQEMYLYLAVITTFGILFASAIGTSPSRITR